jgi:hypothetical protein
MKKQDDVFLLTLVDFLFQIIFFGLFISVLYFIEKPDLSGVMEDIRNKYDKKSDEEIVGVFKKLPNQLDDLTAISKDHEKILKELKRQDYLTVAELTDDLTRLAPIKDLKNGLGTKEESLALLKIIKDSGGSQQSIGLLQKHGVGKPHCLPIVNSSSRLVDYKSIASVSTFDDRIVFDEYTEDFENLLKKMNIKIEKNKAYSFAEFKTNFKNLSSVESSCVHALSVKENTRYIDARDAISPYFRIKRK